MADSMKAILEVVNQRYADQNRKIEQGAKDFLSLCEEHADGVYSSKVAMYEDVRKQLKIWLLGGRQLSQRERSLVLAILKRIQGAIE